jgi:hypothetical protein
MRQNSYNPKIFSRDPQGAEIAYSYDGKVHATAGGHHIGTLRGGKVYSTDARKQASIAEGVPGGKRQTFQLRLAVPDAVGRQPRQVQHQVAPVLHDAARTLRLSRRWLKEAARFSAWAERS